MICRAICWLTLGTLPFLSGCAVPGVIAYKLFGPPPVPPRYAPPKEPMLVLVEEGNRSTGAMIETEELGSALEEELRSFDVAPLVNSNQVEQLRDRGPVAFRSMGIAEIGRRAGAKQVLYVALRRFEFEHPESSDTMRVRVAAEVKVVDTQTQEVRWPASGGEMYEYETPYTRITPQNSQSALRASTIQAAAREIGRMFHAWNPETMTEENREERIR
jgi:hypothetical protein